MDVPFQNKTLQSSLSYSSSCVSGSEFYDAEEMLDVEKEGLEASSGVTLPGAEETDAPPLAPEHSDTSSVAGSVTSEEASLSSEASDLADSEYNPQIGCKYHYNYFRLTH